MLPRWPFDKTTIWFCLYVVAVRFTVASSPYLSAGVSSFPWPFVGGCNPRLGCSVVRSTPGGGLPPSSRDFRAPCRTNCLLTPPGLFTTGDRTKLDFREPRIPEAGFPGIPLLGSSVNKGKKKDRYAEVREHVKAGPRDG